MTFTSLFFLFACISGGKSIRALNQIIMHLNNIVSYKTLGVVTCNDIGLVHEYGLRTQFQ